MYRAELIVLTSLVASIGLCLAPAAKAASFNDLAAFQGASDSLMLIDFETDGDGNTPVDNAEIGSTYAALDIEFLSGNFFTDDFSTPVSGDWGWLSNELEGLDRVLSAEFTTTGIRAVGVHNVMNASVPNGGRLDAYDEFDNLLGSALSDSNPNTLDFFGVTTDADIARFEITAIFPFGWGLDDLYFETGRNGENGGGTHPVPEPSAAVIFGVGLLVVKAGIRRDRRRS